MEGESGRVWTELGLNRAEFGLNPSRFPRSVAPEPGPSPFPKGGASRKAVRPAVQDRNQAAQGSERPLLASCRKRRRLTGPSKSRAFVLPAAPAERFRENARSLSRRSYRITSAGRPPPDGSHRTARTRILLPSPWAAPVPRKDGASVEPPASGPLRRERFRESVPADSSRHPAWKNPRPLSRVSLPPDSLTRTVSASPFHSNLVFQYP